MSIEKPQTVDDYIATFPEKDQQVLQKIRKTILKAVPGAKEVISYQIPTYKQNGILVHFAAFKNHYSLFPGPIAIVAFADQLSSFETSKGTIKFPKNGPIPYDIISKIVQFRIEKNLKKKSNNQ